MMEAVAQSTAVHHPLDMKLSDALLGDCMLLLCPERPPPNDLGRFFELYIGQYDAFSALIMGAFHDKLSLVLAIRNMCVFKQKHYVIL